MGKDYTEEQTNKLGAENVDKVFRGYQARISCQMVKYLGESIIRMISMRAYAALGINNQDELREDLESDPFLNLAVQSFTCELYYRLGSFLAPLSVRMIVYKL